MEISVQGMVELVGGIGSLAAVVKWVGVRLDRAEAAGARREVECQKRQSECEAARMEDYRSIIIPCTEALRDLALNKAESSKTFDRLAIAIASMPQHRDPAEIDAALHRAARDITPQATQTIKG